ncbi:MAG: PilZ domain-containing protein [Candidatus Aureabacteria bacterium]|nr:PilZ domain-containing protein [Candidatus Auribacterota bacterium]
MDPKARYSERRKYPRYDLYLPVHFHIKDSPDDNTPESMKYFQGFTKNFSKGGLLIEALNLSPSQLKNVQRLEAFIEGSILIPTHPRPVRFQARPAWSKKEEDNIELIGLYFTEIQKEDMEILINFAMMLNKKTRIIHFLMSMFFNTAIAVIIMAIYIHYTSSKIIKKQSTTIKRLQQDQKQLRDRIKLIFQKK